MDKDKKISFPIWFVIMSLVGAVLLSVFLNSQKTYSATTTTFDFTTGGNYTFDSNLIEVTGGVARLILLDQTDGDNNATGGFAAGTHSDTQWDATNLWLEMDSTGLANGTATFTSRIMDAGTSTAVWTTSTWTPQRPYFKELPDNSATETAYLSGNMDMRNNVLLLHLNESGANAQEGGTLSDTSGSGNNGTLFTGTDGLNKSASGTLSDAIKFDGSNDYISIADDPSIEFNSGTYSFGGWFKVNALTGTIQTLFSDDNPVNNVITVLDQSGLNLRIRHISVGAACTNNNYGDVVVGKWHHFAVSVTSNVVSLYFDGSFVGSGCSGAPSDISEVWLGRRDNAGGDIPFNGSLDEIFIFSRALSANEILDIYKRGALKLRYQVRSCDDDACSGETFAGPDGTASDFYSELGDNGINTPSTTFSNVAANRYFQYQASFLTASSTLSPELKAVTTTPAHYDGSDATIVNSATAPSYSVISSFSETLGSNNEGTVRYQLSPDNTYWHYWNNSNWVSSTLGYDHANTSTLINTNILGFDDDVGSGTFYLKAFYRSNNAEQQVEIDSVSIVTDPTISFTTSSLSGAEDGGTINIQLELSVALAANATVNYTVSTTATTTASGSGTDYTLADGTATITAGNTTTSIDIVLNDDTLDENSETIVIDLSLPSNAILGPTTTHTYTITDNDSSPTISFTSSTYLISEGTTPTDIQIELSAVSGLNVTVDYTVSTTATTTASGSGTDYTLANGTATITAGNTTTTIAATIVDDSLDENNETIVIDIASPTNSTLGPTTTHTYIIEDDDVAPTISFTSSSYSGLESTTPTDIQIELSAVSGLNVTVDYTVSTTATTTASGSGTDYTLANGTATITAGNTTTTIEATINDDSLDETNEVIVIDIASPTNSTLGPTTTHTYTITDDDAAPLIDFTDATGSGLESTTPVSIEIQLSATSSLDATVDYALTGTATGSGTDYTLADGTATISAGDSTTTLSLVIVDDSTDDDNENVILTLSSPSNSSLGTNTTYTYTITDNDDAPAEEDTSGSAGTSPGGGGFSAPIFQAPATTLPTLPPSEEPTKSADEAPIEIGKTITEVPETIVKTIIEVPEKIIDKIVESVDLPAQAGKIPIKIGKTTKDLSTKVLKKVKTIKQLIPDFLKPGSTEVTPDKLALHNIWDLLPSKPIVDFVETPLVSQIQTFTNKFPSLQKTFVDVGIGELADSSIIKPGFDSTPAIESNLEKIKNIKFILPGITTSIGAVSLPKAKPLNQMTQEEKDKLPTEVVFIRSNNENIDFNLKLSIDKETQKTQQKIDSIAGKELKLVVKPENKVKKIRGFILVKKVKQNKSSLLQIILSAITIPVASAQSADVETIEDKTEIQKEFVLLEFEYTDPDGDGIYTADIQTPLIEGEYEILTVMDYEDINLGQKAIRLVTVVDPEGYVFEKIAGKELRLPDAKISIFYQDPQTKEYILWPADEYNQENPQKTDRTGTYSFLVPEGKYYLQAESKDYITYRGESFDVKEGSGVHENIELQSRYWWKKWLDWRIGLIAGFLVFIIVLLLRLRSYRERLKERIMSREDWE